MSDPPLQRLPGGEPPTAALQTSGPQAAENGDDEEEEEEDMEDDVDSSHLQRFVRERRRARSLPALFRGGGVSGSDSGKRVKFADAFGLNLASVKHYSTLEEPRIPSKVLARLRSFPPQQQQQRDFLDELCASFTSGLSTCVPQTGGTSEELEARAQRLRVSLETVTVTRFDVRGHIRVFSDCSRKEVGVRYTFDDWLSHVDAQALSCPVRPGLTGERFAFTMYTPPFLGPGSSVHFAVYLRSEEGEFWDNNEGQNYTLGYHSLPSMAPFVSAAFHAT
ncbi:protein phosphatase 1 regulatory subunit 3G [Polymixia lowei]